MPQTPYRIRLFTVAAAFVGLLSAGCSSDSYDTGDGNYSYLTADFALVTTDASAALVAASTDDGASLSFDRPYKAGWTAKPDTVYRALVYYDKKPTEKVALRAVTQIPVMAVHKPEDVKDMTDAPLGVESVWKAKNGKYVNVALLLKTGKMDDSSQGQTIALVCDSFSDTEDGRKVAELRFVHDQGGVPQYYTSRVYVSIPIAEFSDVDKIDITFNTYNGTVRKALSIK